MMADKEEQETIIIFDELGETQAYTPIILGCKSD